MAQPWGVSVVIAHYGDPGLANRLIDHLEASELTRPLEVIVVDDRSPVPFPDRRGVHVVRREVNGGFGSAINSGVAAATMPLVAILNSDLTCGPDALERLAARVQEVPHALVGSAVIEDGKLLAAGNAFPEWRDETLRRVPALERTGLRGKLRRTKIARPALGELPSWAHLVDWVPGPVMALTKELFDQLGGFDERFFMYFEEVDLQLRLSQAGGCSVIDPEIVLTHDGQGSTNEANIRPWHFESLSHYSRKHGFHRRLVAGYAAATAANQAHQWVRVVTGKGGQPRARLRQDLAALRSLAVGRVE